MANLSDSELQALQQILDYAQQEEGKSQGGYFSYGWAGTVLKELLKREREEAPQGRGSAV